MTKRRPPHRARNPSPRVAKIPDAPDRRKLIGFDAATWQALDQLARDRMMSVQELAEEAFADLLAKHQRPTDLRRALKASADEGGRSRRRS